MVWGMTRRMSLYGTCTSWVTWIHVLVLELRQIFTNGAHVVVLTITHVQRFTRILELISTFLCTQIKLFHLFDITIRLFFMKINWFLPPTGIPWDKPLELGRRSTCLISYLRDIASCIILMLIFIYVREREGGVVERINIVGHVVDRGCSALTFTFEWFIAESHRSRSNWQRIWSARRAHASG